MAILKFLVVFTSAASAAWFLSVFAQDNNKCGPFCEHSITTWDGCNLAIVGHLYKSVSKCYLYKDPNSNPNSTGRCVNRYDYYRCLRINGVMVLYPGNCTGPQVPFYRHNTTTNTYTLDIFNRFDNATKKCSLVPPAFVPSTTMDPEDSTPQIPFDDIEDSFEFINEF